METIIEGAVLALLQRLNGLEGEQNAFVSGRDSGVKALLEQNLHFWAFDARRGMFTAAESGVRTVWMNLKLPVLSQ